MSSVLRHFRPHGWGATVSLSICVAACETSRTPVESGSGGANLLSNGSGYSVPIVLASASSGARGINDSGVIVGVWNDQAFRQANGVITDIGTPAGCSSSTAEAVNNLGVITGTCVIALGGVFGNRAFRWSVSTGITLLPGISGNGSAIDNLNRIAGTYDANGLLHPVWWDSHNGLHDISPAGFGGFAYGINDFGQIVGQVEALSGPESPGFLWNGTVTFLPTLGGPRGVAFDINEKGLVVGGSMKPDTSWDAFRWTASGGIEALGGSPDAFAQAVNSKGRIVGSSGDGAFTWKGGQAWLLPRGASLSTFAADVNSCGAIVGSATFADGDHAVLWVRRRCEISTVLPD